MESRLEQGVARIEKAFGVHCVEAKHWLEGTAANPQSQVKLVLDLSSHQIAKAMCLGSRVGTAHVERIASNRVAVQAGCLDEMGLFLRAIH